MEEILPGPVQRTVLFDNSYHISEDVWGGVERGPLGCFCGSWLLRSWKLSEAQKELLHAVGFGLFANNNVMLQNDTSLITALVERWRPETNTFFMRQGEMTITLEDVGYILGLPTFGEPLVGNPMNSPKAYFARNWFERLTDEEVSLGWQEGRGGIKFTWLHDRYGGLPGDDPVRIGVHTQAYLMLVIGVVLFPTRSRNVVHPKYMDPVFVIEAIHTYSWGSAVLAYLYRGLEHAAKKGSRHIFGCVYLLMIWSYERFVVGRPIPDLERDPYPLGEAWAYSRGRDVPRKRREGKTGPHHNLPHYRSEFDGVGSDVVQWTPYDRFIGVDGDEYDSVQWEARLARLAKCKA